MGWHEVLGNIDTRRRMVCNSAMQHFSRFRLQWMLRSHPCHGAQRGYDYLHLRAVRELSHGRLHRRPAPATSMQTPLLHRLIPNGARWQRRPAAWGTPQPSRSCSCRTTTISRRSSGSAATGLALSGRCPPTAAHTGRVPRAAPPHRQAARQQHKAALFMAAQLRCRAALTRPRAQLVPQRAELQRFKAAQFELGLTPLAGNVGHVPLCEPELWLLKVAPQQRNQQEHRLLFCAA